MNIDEYDYRLFKYLKQDCLLFLRLLEIEKERMRLFMIILIFIQNEMISYLDDYSYRENLI